MKIKRNPLIFHNLLSVTEKCKNDDEWMIHAVELKKSIVKNGFYVNGPVIYTVKHKENEEIKEYTIYIPVNKEMQLEENEKYTFIEELKFDDGLLLRHADLEEDIKTTTYDLLDAVAVNYKLKLKHPFYNIYLNVFGEGIIDVYAPIEQSDMEVEHD